MRLEDMASTPICHGPKMSHDGTYRYLSLISKLITQIDKGKNKLTITYIKARLLEQS